MTDSPLETLADTIQATYVFPDEGARIAAHLRTTVPDGLSAAALTDVIRQVSPDRHLRVRERPAARPASEPDWRAHYAEQARSTAGGIAAVERLDDNTGVLTIAPYTAPVDLAELYVRAAFALVRGIDALIIDLRGGRGGTPETIALICGHLLGDEPVHLQDMVNRTGERRQFWTQPAADRLPRDVPIAVLTSTRTFSGCEELAYNLQALRRAVVIGETTGGGAHPIEVVVLDDDLEVTVPVERSVNAVTGTNWEQLGVQPDVPHSAEEALDCARRHMSGTEVIVNTAG